MTAQIPDRIMPAAPTGSGAVDTAIVIWRALAALGVRDVVAAPGSRSAPLVYGLTDPQVAGRLRAHARIDERAAAFTALGISRQDPAHPGAVFTTSGTATAHLLAAVMEAHHSRIPLLVLTADRPAELRGTGANQTTLQPGLFDDFVRLAADLPAPTADAATPVELRTAVSTLARAVAAAQGEHPGPVHVNLGFRDPLVPRSDPAAAETPRDTVPVQGPIVLTRRAPSPSPTPHEVPISDRTVVVAGDGAGAAAADLAREQGLPLLAEPSSGARDSPQLVTGYPALLGRIMARPDHPLRPDRAIVLGHPTLSRPVLGALLGADDVEVVVVDPHPDFADAARRAQLVVPAATAAPVAAETLEARRDRTRWWQDEAAGLRDEITALPWQTRAALAVWEATTAADTLVLGSSSLVRDLEAQAGPTAGRVIANRGLAGIDGTISLAGGIALARGHDLARERPDGPAPGRVRLLLGDLTAVHDLTGLVIGPDEARPDLDVIIVDDQGGRIFGGLEHAAAPAEVLRRFFTTPHGTDLAGTAEALGASAHRTDPETLPTLLAAPAGGLRVLVVQEGAPGAQPAPDAGATSALPSGVPAAAAAMAQPDGVRPGTVPPGTAQTGTAQPDAAPSGSAQADSAPSAAARRRGPTWSGVTALVVAGMLAACALSVGGITVYDRFFVEPGSGPIASSEPAPTDQASTPTAPVTGEGEGSLVSPASTPVDPAQEPDWAGVAELVAPSAVALQVSTGTGTGQGTGVILDSAGTILTNDHVLSGQETALVTLHDGLSYEATVIGSDPTTDLAVVRLDSPPEGLVPATFGDSDQVQVGQPVMAVGTPLGLENTVTTGIVSARDRPVTTEGDAEDGSDSTFTSALQTDAAINPGNSGGPLVDAAGRVIGINTAIAGLAESEGTAGSIGLGFAIPSSTAQLIAPQLAETGTAQHAYLGVTTSGGTTRIDEVTHRGADVIEVVAGSPAEESGLREGDLITRVGEVPVRDAAALTGVIRGLPIGSSHTLTFLRAGAVQQAEVTLTAQEQ